MEIQMRIRVPAKVKAWLQARAGHADRSMNAEILQLLKSAMRADEASTPGH